MEKEQKTQQPPNQGNAANRAGSQFFDWVRSLKIGRGDQRWFAGVCAGVANRIGIDPLIVRGLMVVAGILGLPVVFLYLLGWSLLPDTTGYSHVERIFRGVGTATSWIVSILTVLSVLGEVGFGSYRLGSWLPWVVIAALIGWGIYAFANSQKDHPNNNQQNGQQGQSGPGPGHTGGSTQASGPGQTTGPAGQGSAAAFAANAQPSADTWEPVSLNPTRGGVGAPGAAMLIGFIILVGAIACLIRLAVGGATGGDVLFVGLVSALVATGLSALIVALSGRTVGAWSGWMGAILAPLVLAAGTFGSIGVGPVKLLGDEHLTAASVGAQPNQQFGIGDQTVDLTDSSYSLAGQTAHLTSGIGDTTIVIPSDVPIKLRLIVGVGDIENSITDTEGNTSGTNSKIGGSQLLLFEGGKQVDSFSAPDVASRAATINLTKGIGTISLETK